MYLYGRQFRISVFVNIYIVKVSQAHNLNKDEKVIMRKMK